MLDIGLLGAQSGLDITVLLEHDDALFGMFNGAMTEQFVMQELINSGFTPFYWGRDKGEAEVDFVIQWRNEIVPVEVKSGIRTKSKSLAVYRNMYHPARVVRSTLKNFGIAGDLYSVPLYMTASLGDILSVDL
jgi:predicted AAA+ superfamily ATPase